MVPIVSEVSVYIRMRFFYC